MFDPQGHRLRPSLTVAALWLSGCAKGTEDDGHSVDTGGGQETVDCTYEWGCWVIDGAIVASGSPNSSLSFRQDHSDGHVRAELVLRSANICAGGGATAPSDWNVVCSGSSYHTNTFGAEHQGTALPDLSQLPTEWEVDLLLLECLGYQSGSDLFRYRRIPTAALVEISAVDDHMVHFDLRSEADIDREAGPGDSTLTVTTEVQVCDYAGVTPFRAP